MPKLIVQHEDREWTVELRDGVNVLGRASSCSIPIRDPGLSRAHCEIVLEEGVATVKDKGSLNGTLVNGKRVPEQRLQPGDRISIGHTTLWFEEKKASESPPTSSRRKPAVGKVAAEADPLLRDYSAGKMKAGGSRMFLWAAAILVVAGAAALAAHWMGGASPGEVDRDNLLGPDGMFDAESARGWAMAAGSKGVLSALPGGRSGGCLAIDRGGASLEECVYGKDFPVGKDRQVEVSAYARFDGPGGGVGMTVAWLGNASGLVLAEEAAPIVPQGDGWTPIGATFVPPTGAVACRVALAALGRGGRIFFDDAAVRIKPGGGLAAGVEARREHTRVEALRRNGVLGLDLDGRPVLVNVHLALESETAGALPQVFVREGAVQEEAGQIHFKGRLVGPVGLRDVAFEERAAPGDEEIMVAYAFPGESLREADRVILTATLPRADRVKGAGTKTNRISFTSDGTERLVEFSEFVQVRAEPGRGGLKLSATFPVDPTARDVELGFRLCHGRGGGRGQNPEDAAEAAVKKRALARALEILKEAAAGTRDPVARERLEGKARELESSECREWEEARALALLAAVFQRPERIDAALQATGLYLQHWAESETFAARGKTLTDELQRLQADASVRRDGDRPARILAHAKDLAEDGRKALARAMLETVVTCYAASDAAPEARALLQSLSESEKE